MLFFNDCMMLMHDLRLRASGFVYRTLKRLVPVHDPAHRPYLHDLYLLYHRGRLVVHLALCSCFVVLVADPSPSQ